jgi:hypothetical protein
MLQLQGTLIAGVPTSEKVERKARKRLTEEGGSKPFYSSSRHLWVTWSSCRELMSWEPTQAIAWFCKESFTGTQLHFYTLSLASFSLQQQFVSLEITAHEA